jgi:hypothetical protein
LLLGAKVQIRLGNTVIKDGFVDAVMPDSSVIWLAADAVQPPTMYDAGSGYEVWAEVQVF